MSITIYTTHKVLPGHVDIRKTCRSLAGKPLEKCHFEGRERVEKISQDFLKGTCKSK